MSHLIFQSHGDTDMLRCIRLAPLSLKFPFTLLHESNEEFNLLAILFFQCHNDYRRNTGASTPVTNIHFWLVTQIAQLQQYFCETNIIQQVLIHIYSSSTVSLWYLVLHEAPVFPLGSLFGPICTVKFQLHIYCT